MANTETEYPASHEEERNRLREINADLIAALKQWKAAYARIKEMAGWTEGDCDLWISPEMDRVEVVFSDKAIAKAEGR